jgi:hypothetical protein
MQTIVSGCQGRMPGVSVKGRVEIRLAGNRRIKRIAKFTAREHGIVLSNKAKAQRRITARERGQAEIGISAATSQKQNQYGKR